MKSKVAVIMGSDSDFPTLKGAIEALTYFHIPYTAQVLSAHRTPNEVAGFAKNAASEGYQVVIAGAGGSAHLPGMVASHTTLPVIGVPVLAGALLGKDALFSILQMPNGLPVATVGINSAFNAGLLAVQIIAAQGDEKLSIGLIEFKEKMRLEVLQKKLPAQT